jgi:hypothetical protein
MRTVFLVGGWLGAAFPLVVLACAAGCSTGQSSGRPDVDAISDEVHFGTASKGLLYEFRAKVKKHGVEAARQELPQLLESFEGYERRKLGESAGTYKEIVEKLKALEGTLGTASREDVIKAADEIGALADKLPGEADPNPQVE